MTGAQAVAEILKREGVNFLVAYPLNPIIEACAAADIRPIIVRQERTGLHMADAFSRLSSGERIGVFAMQHGPGTENAFGGVAQAFADSVPIVVLPAGYPRARVNVPPNFNAAANYGHVTKWIEQVVLPESIPDALRRAFTQVRNGRPRPVLVEFPTDVLQAEVREPLSYRPSLRARTGPDPEAIEVAAATLAAARLPVVYAGQGIHYARAWESLRELAELLDAPVTTSLQGKSAFPESHPLSLGSGGRAMPETVRHFLDEADVILGIGCSFATTTYGARMPAGKKIIHATLDPGDLQKDVACDQALLGDADLVLRALCAAVRERLGPGARGRAQGLAAEIASMRSRWLDRWMPKLTSDAVPLSPYRVIWELQRVLGSREVVITHDAGSPRDELSPFWISDRPLSYIGWGKSTQLGYGLGLAMGAKLARPEALCVNVWGDAAIGFTGMDLETAVRERIPILSILLNNSSMAVELPRMRTATAKFRSTDISGCYADLARSLGCAAEKVVEPDEIAPAIRRAVRYVDEGTPALLEFITQQETVYSVYD